MRTNFGDLPKSWFLFTALWNLTAQLSKANANYLISSYCPKHVCSCKYRYLLCPTYILKGRNLQKINIFTYFYAGSSRPAAWPAFPCQVQRGDTITRHQGCCTKTRSPPLLLSLQTTIFCVFLARASRFSSWILAMVNQGVMAAGLRRAITAGPGLIWKWN